MGTKGEACKRGIHISKNPVMGNNKNTKKLYANSFFMIKKLKKREVFHLLVHYPRPSYVVFAGQKQGHEHTHNHLACQYHKWKLRLLATMPAHEIIFLIFQCLIESQVYFNLYFSIISPLYSHI